MLFKIMQFVEQGIMEKNTKIINKSFIFQYLFFPSLTYF